MADPRTEHFLAAIRTGELRLPDGMSVTDIDDGTAVQLEVLAELESQGAGVGGWKIGLSSKSARRRAGSDGIAFGFVLAHRVLRSGSVIRSEQLGRGGLETELCFAVGDDLSGEANRDDVLAAITTVAPAFEVNQFRCEVDAELPVLVADGLASWGIVVGTPVPLPADLHEVEVSVRCNGIDIVGPARSLVDEHLGSIADLCRRLHHHGRGLRAGERIVTGSFTRHEPREPASAAATWEASYGSVGTVVVTFA